MDSIRSDGGKYVKDLLYRKAPKSIAIKRENANVDYEKKSRKIALYLCCFLENVSIEILFWKCKKRAKYR